MGTTAAPAATRPAARAAARSPAPAVLLAKSLALAPATPRPCACGGRCPRCATPRLSEPGDALEREADALADRALPSAVAVEPAAPAAGPQPLPQALRHWLQAQLQIDLAPVRVHAHPAAARRAKALRARAFTAGNDVFFAAGRYAPHTRAGLRLLAHEVAHVRHQRAGRAGAGSVVQRTPEDAEVAAEAESIGLDATLDPDALPAGPTVEPGDTQVDLRAGPLYDGDSFGIVFQHGDDAQPVEAAALPAEVQALTWDTSPRLLLRVSEGASARGDLQLALRVGLQRRPLRVTIHVRPVPPLPQVRDAGLELSESNRESVRRLGGHLRDEHRALPLKERLARRRARAQERRELRHARRARRQEARAAERKRGCTLEQLRIVNAALHRAAGVVRAALARLQAGAQGTQVRQALLTVFGPRASDSPLEAAAVVARAQVVLTLVRNGLHVVQPEQVDCGGEGCDPVTGAYVTSLTRSASVSLCAIYFRPGLSFENARGLEDAQAYALVHEFTHLAGVEAPEVLNKRTGEYERPPEEYHGERDWDHLDLNQRRQMVDAYAAMAWRLGAR